MDTKTAVQMFDSLASEVRLDVIKLLVKFGEDGLVAGDIASTLQIPSTNLSFHLKALTHAGLITATQEGRYQRYRANLTEMMGLVNFLMAECCAQQQDGCSTVECNLISK